MPLIPGKGHVGDNIKEFRGGQTYAHTADKFGHGRAEKQAQAVALHEQDKGEEHPRSHHAALHAAAGSDHKSAIAQMHPEHLHRLVQEAHAGKYGPQAQQTAQQCMPTAGAPAGPPQGQAAPAPARGAMFGGGGMQEPDQDDVAPPNRAAMFAGSRGGM